MPHVQIDGLRFHYCDDDFTDPWRPREVVMINHYGYGNARLYYKWVPVFASEYRVLRFDRRGFGDSETPPYPYELTAQAIIDDFVGFLDALAIDKVHFVGDRFGGSLGGLLAAHHPERIATLTMIASPCDCQRLAAIFTAGAESIYREGSWLDAHKAWAVGAVNAARGTPEDILKALYMREQMAKVAPHVLAAHRRFSADPRFTLAPLLKDIAAPTLMITPRDAAPLLTMDEQAMMSETIPDCTQVVIDNADRDFAWLEPERCAAEVLHFIRAHSALAVSADNAYDVAKQKR